MVEIVTRHQIRKWQAGDDPLACATSTNAGIFEVTAAENANPYSSRENDAEDVEKPRQFVEIKIFDVLYQKRVCNLIYLRDITKDYGLYHQFDNESIRGLKSEEKKNIEQFLKHPKKFKEKLHMYLENTFRSALSATMLSALSELELVMRKLFVLNQML